MPLLYGLAPVLPPAPRLLILGSFPSPESLRRRQYYAKNTNRFWRLVGEFLGEPQLAKASYEVKLSLLSRNGIALWDVIAACERAGAADSKIRQPQWNPLVELLQTQQSLQRIVLNGSTAARFFAIAAMNWPGGVCPVPSFSCLSTSAANQKYGPWDKLRENWSPHLSFALNLADYPAGITAS